MSEHDEWRTAMQAGPTDGPIHISGFSSREGRGTSAGWPNSMPGEQKASAPASRDTGPSAEMRLWMTFSEADQPASFRCTVIPERNKTPGFEPL